MEEIRNASLAYYKTGSEAFKNTAHQFFKMLDNQANGRASVRHLDEFFKERGYEPFHPNLLKELGKEPTDFLDFTDAFVLYYVAVARRPYCDICEAFLKGLYFPCLDCFVYEDKAYNLCNSCFCKEKGSCRPHGHVTFLDNFAALQAKSKAAQDLKRNIKYPHPSVEKG